MHRQYDLLLELARRRVRRNPSGAFAGRTCGRRLRSEGADGSHGNARGHLYIASAQRRCRRAQEGRLLGRAHRATQADYAVECHRCDPLSREVVGISSATRKLNWVIVDTSPYHSFHFFGFPHRTIKITHSELSNRAVVVEQALALKEDFAGAEVESVAIPMLGI